MTLLALALAPIVFIFTYVYLKDKYDKEPLRYLIITFILGICTAAPVLYVGEQLRIFTQTSAESSTIIELMIYAFFVVATTEEGMKYLVLRFYNYPHKEFDEPYDGIMYGVAVSLGFAAIENVLYVFLSDGAGYQTGLLRMFTAVPAHAVFGVMMGYYVGHAKFIVEGDPMIEQLKGLGMAILFHGLYDFFLFLPSSGVLEPESAWGSLALLAFVTLFVGIRLARKAMREHSAISPHKETHDAATLLEEEEPPSNSET
ncbi:MAG: protease PrsW [Bacteroidetes bacterium]|nr:MAG: protease PrsW [Bacteroidota bacterium]